MYRTFVLSPHMSSKRTLYPTSIPTAAPISAATRFARAIAGSLLGCVTAILGPLANREACLSLE